MHQRNRYHHCWSDSVLNTSWRQWDHHSAVLRRLCSDLCHPNLCCAALQLPPRRLRLESATHVRSQCVDLSVLASVLHRPPVRGLH